MYYLLGAVFILTWAITWCVRAYAISKNIMDTPNHRSSHAMPTPRGGGLAFVIVFLGTIIGLIYTGYQIPPGSWYLVGGSLFVALLGFLDDQINLPAHLRLIGHFVAACFVIYGLGGMPAITFVTWTIPIGFILNTFAVIYLVWLLNLYNFMDGTDGLAGIEAICTCLGAVCLYALSGQYELIILPAILAATVAGFLIWNFPPARIFMGDAGSGFLGFTLGVLSIQATNINRNFFWSWLILLGVFIVDATYTLIIRICRRDKVHEAHRSHAYQKASIRFGGHLPLALSTLIINLVWLWPLSILVGLNYINAFIGLCMAYLPLILVVIYFKAGQPD